MSVVLQKCLPRVNKKRALGTHACGYCNGVERLGKALEEKLRPANSPA